MEDLVGAKRFCRFCNAPLRLALVDLGEVPLANSYLSEADLDAREPRFSLQPLLCESCFLVQLPEWEKPEAIFSDYAYFSSYSESWLEHCRRYCEAATRRFSLHGDSLVVEVASNDGYLLQYFHSDGIPVLGIEPAANVAEAAEAKGIRTRRAFFGEEVAAEMHAEGLAADLLVANNVLAHTPHLNDFVAGIARVLKPTGVATLEFPHLLRLLDETQFDTIYHEHYSYFSLSTAARIFSHHGLRTFDVDELPTHGGSLRLYVSPDPKIEVAGRVTELIERERRYGLSELETYGSFERRAEEVCAELLDFLEAARERGEQVLGYGAPAKGNTLLCYCEIGPDLLPFTVDRSPHKQGLYLPGSRIPIRAPADLIAARPDYVLVLPWNLRREIIDQLDEIRSWGGRFITAIPRLEVHH